MRELGAELIAISPQTREHNAAIRERHGLEFPVLSDVGNAYARKLGIVHALPTDLRDVYTQFGISLPEHNGDDTWELPLPTRIVVDADGVIRRIDADPDYTHRPEPEQTLAALRSLTGRG